MVTRTYYILIIFTLRQLKTKTKRNKNTKLEEKEISFVVSSHAQNYTEYHVKYAEYTRISHTPLALSHARTHSFAQQTHSNKRADTQTHTQPDIYTHKHVFNFMCEGLMKQFAIYMCISVQFCHHVRGVEDWWSITHRFYLAWRPVFHYSIVNVWICTSCHRNIRKLLGEINKFDL